MRWQNFLACWLGLCLATVAVAGGAPLRVAVDENLFPYTFARANGEAAGADVELLREAGRRAGVELSFEALPWKRVLLQVEAGEVPLALPLFFTAERAQFAQFVAPVHFSATALFVRKGQPLNFQEVLDLAGKRIGYNRGYALPDDLRRAIASGLVAAEEVNTTAQNIQKLLAGRIDAFVGNHTNTLLTLRQIAGGERVQALPKLLSAQRPAYLVLSRRAVLPERERLEAALKKALEALVQEGASERLLAQYVKDELRNGR